MAGRRPDITPSEKRVQHNRTEDVRRAEIAPIQENPELIPPTYLTQGAKAIWQNILAKYEKYGVKILNELDTYTLENFCVLQDLRTTLYKRWKTKEKKAIFKDELTESVTKDGEDVKKSSTTTTSSVINPTIKEMIRLDADIMKYADKLGLTPLGRATYACRTEKKERESVAKDIEFFNGDDDDVFLN